MTKVYEVRTKEGVLKFTLPERLALKTIATYRGTWRSANYKSGVKVNQYILKESAMCEISHPSGESILLYMWAEEKIDIVER